MGVGWRAGGEVMSSPSGSHAGSMGPKCAFLRIEDVECRKWLDIKGMQMSLARISTKCLGWGYQLRTSIHEQKHGTGKNVEKPRSAYLILMI